MSKVYCLNFSPIHVSTLTVILIWQTLLSGEAQINVMKRHDINRKKKGSRTNAGQMWFLIVIPTDGMDEKQQKKWSGGAAYQEFEPSAGSPNFLVDRKKKGGRCVMYINR